MTPKDHTNSAGIERLNIYGSSLYIAVQELAKGRGKDSAPIIDRFRAERLSLNPPYEDAVTMAANAAEPLLNDEDRAQIGLLITGTESAYDLSKPMSTHLIDALKLPKTIKNFEIKHACYSGTAGLQCALNWINSGANRGKKALVVTSDISRRHFNRPIEFIRGGAAAAMIVSDTPRIIAYEDKREGVWSINVYDTFRPSVSAEEADGALSLFSYNECLENSYEQYVRSVGTPIDFHSHFDYLLYHMPFPAMALQAHRSLCNRIGIEGSSNLMDDFVRRVEPSLFHASQIGSSYGTGVFTALAGLIDLNSSKIRGGERVGVFSYGSGAIGEFYSGILCSDAYNTVASMRITDALASRRPVSFEEYEEIENERESAIGRPDLTPELDMPKGWFDSFYLSHRRLILKAVKDYRRIYEWSC